jgi:hypothetical protein
VLNEFIPYLHLAKLRVRHTADARISPVGGRALDGETAVTVRPEKPGFKGPSHPDGLGLTVVRPLDILVPTK